MTEIDMAIYQGFFAQMQHVLHERPIWRLNSAAIVKAEDSPKRPDLQWSNAKAFCQDAAKQKQQKAPWRKQHFEKQLNQSALVQH